MKPMKIVSVMGAELSMISMESKVEPFCSRWKTHRTRLGQLRYSFASRDSSDTHGGLSVRFFCQNVIGTNLMVMKPIALIKRKT